MISHAPHLLHVSLNGHDDVTESTWKGLSPVSIRKNVDKGCGLVKGVIGLPAGTEQRFFEFSSDGMKTKNGAKRASDIAEPVSILHTI